MIDKRAIIVELIHAEGHLSNASDTPDPEEKDVHIKLALTLIKGAIERESHPERIRQSDKDIKPNPK